MNCSLGQYFRFLESCFCSSPCQPTTKQKTWDPILGFLLTVTIQTAPKQPYSVPETPHTAVSCKSRVPLVPSNTKHAHIYYVVRMSTAGGYFFFSAGFARELDHPSVLSHRLNVTLQPSRCNLKSTHVCDVMSMGVPEA